MAPNFACSHSRVDVVETCEAIEGETVAEFLCKNVDQLSKFLCNATEEKAIKTLTGITVGDVCSAFASLGNDRILKQFDAQVKIFTTPERCSYFCDKLVPVIDRKMDNVCKALYLSFKDIKAIGQDVSTLEMAEKIWQLKSYDFPPAGLAYPTTCVQTTLTMKGIENMNITHLCYGLLELANDIFAKRLADDTSYLMPAAVKSLVFAQQDHCDKMKGFSDYVVAVNKKTGSAGEPWEIVLNELVSQDSQQKCRTLCQGDQGIVCTLFYLGTGALVNYRSRPGTGSSSASETGTTNPPGIGRGTENLLDKGKENGGLSSKEIGTSSPPAIEAGKENLHKGPQTSDSSAKETVTSNPAGNGLGAGNLRDQGETGGSTAKKIGTGSKLLENGTGTTNSLKGAGPGLTTSVTEKSEISSQVPVPVERGKGLNTEDDKSNTETPEQGDKPKADTPEQGDKPKGDTPEQGDKPKGDTPEQQDKPKGDTSEQEDKPKADSPEQEDKPKGDTPEQEDKPKGDTPEQDKPKGDTPEQEDKPEGDTPEQEGKPKGDTSKVAQSSVLYGDVEDDESPSSGHFMAYMLTLIVLCVAGYIVFHNKQKIIAFIVEGRNGRESRGRPSTKEYKRVTTDDVMPSLEKSTTASNYIY